MRLENVRGHDQSPRQKPGALPTISYGRTPSATKGCWTCETPAAVQARTDWVRNYDGSTSLRDVAIERLEIPHGSRKGCGGVAECRRCRLG